MSSSYDGAGEGDMGGSQGMGGGQGQRWTRRSSVAGNYPQRQPSGLNSISSGSPCLFFLRLNTLSSSIQVDVSLDIDALSDIHDHRESRELREICRLVYTLAL